MLGQRLEHVGCKTRHAKGDANVLIVETTVQSAMYWEPTLVGDDTDLLVLMCFHVMTGLLIGMRVYVDCVYRLLRFCLEYSKVLLFLLLLECFFRKLLLLFT